MFSNSKKLGQFVRSKTFIGAGVVVVILIVFYFLAHQTKKVSQTVVVTRGSITESVSVTGNTTPIHSVLLGFNSGGTISYTGASVGQSVTTGTLLASLNTSDLGAQSAQAQANVDAQVARLNGLLAGTRGEDIAASQASVDKSVQDLTNIYSSTADAVNDSYAKGNDAIRTQTSTFFSNAENSNIQLTFNTSNTQPANDAKAERLVLATTLINWQNSIFNVPFGFSPTDSDVARIISSSLSNLSDIRQYILNMSTALNGATSLDVTTLGIYKSNLAFALTEVNTASKNLNTITQNIASQKSIIAQAGAVLTLKKIGASQQDIMAQQAQIKQAEAAVASIQAKFSNSRIIAPIDGVVTQFDAKNGQIASPGVILVAVISNNQLEVDSQVPETDIGKVAVGDIVDMTFDAFPGQIFSGKVFYIDPAQTVNQGVVQYKIKISFAGNNTQIKSGLTANLTIKTKTNTNVLILPQYAVLQNDTGTFVRTTIGGISTSTRITLGIQDQNGNVEVLSGVTEGEQVQNIGLKQ